MVRKSQGVRSMVCPALVRAGATCVEFCVCRSRVCQRCPPFQCWSAPCSRGIDRGLFLVPFDVFCLWVSAVGGQAPRWGHPREGGGGWLGLVNAWLHGVLGDTISSQGWRMVWSQQVHWVAALPRKGSRISASPGSGSDGLVLGLLQEPRHLWRIGCGGGGRDWASHRSTPCSARSR